MSTPFEFFRRNQKVALAAVTGMAILSFLVADAASNQGKMSGPAVAVLFTGCLAIAGWISGVKENKSRENAIFGIVLGLAVSLLFMFMNQKASSVAASSGSISQENLQDLSRQRMLSNRMVGLVHRNANPADLNQRGPQQFNYTGSEGEEELIVTQLLLREADKFGIQVDREAALNYLKEVAGQDENGETRLTKSVYAESLKDTVAAAQGVSEASVLKSLQEELRARAASEALFGSARLTPQNYWDLHRKMAIRQSSHFVALPVEEFYDKSEPGEAELKELFAAHRKNFPNFTEAQEYQPGLPGFFLQRRVKLAYLEPDYEAIEKQVPAITDEEVQKRYEESYKRAVPDRSMEDFLPQLPELPVVPKKPEAVPPVDDAPAAETPKTEPAPPTDKPAAPEAKPADSKPDAAPSATPPEASKADAPAPEAPAPEAPKTEAPAEPAPAAEQPQSSIRTRPRAIQTVAFLAEEPAAPAAETPAAPAVEAPATEKPAEAPAVEKPAETPAPEAPAKEATDAKPAEEKPADAKPADEKPAEPAKTEEGAAPPAPTGSAPLTVPATETSTDADGDPAPPVADVRPLTEELKQQIRDELLREKTDPLKKEKITAAQDFMAGLGERVQEYLDHQKAENKAEYPLSKDALKPEEASKLLKEFAEKNGYVYTETPLSTYAELRDSEDHPVGMARLNPQLAVVDASFRLEGDLFVANSASSFISGAQFAYWKVEDSKAHEPETIDEPGVRDMVIKAWRDAKARPLAEKRANELAELIRKSDKPIEEALAEQTVNGQPAALFVTVKATGDYQWVTTGGGFGAPRAGDILGIEPREIDEPFRTKLFEEMKPGDVGVLPNADRSQYYVMKIDTRSHMTEAEQETLRKGLVGSSDFMQSFILQMALTQTEQQALSQQFVERLEERHGIKLNQ